METYTQMMQRHYEELSGYRVEYAFDDTGETTQLSRAMARLGLDPSETNKISRTCLGGVMLKEDAVRYRETCARHRREKQNAIDADETGDGFVYQMFCHEIGNSEYAQTGNPHYALNALGYASYEVIGDPKLRHGFEKAIMEIDARRCA